MSRILFAPVVEKFLQADGVISKTWLHFLSDVGGALKGDWTKTEITLNVSGASAQPSRTVLAKKGSTFEISIVWSETVSFNSGSFFTLTLDQKNFYSFEKTILTLLNDDKEIVGHAVPNNKFIEIKSNESLNSCILSGTLILK